MIINEVITDIIDAEAKAEQIITKANEAAKEITLSLHSESEQLKAEYANNLKENIKKIMSNAEQVAEKNAIEQTKSAEANAEKIVKVSEKHVLHTVEWLAELLVKQNS